MRKPRYNPEFKANAVALVESGMTQKTVCTDLGVSKSALSKWVQDAELTKRGVTPATDPVDRRELAKQLRRIRELEMENEVLRRAAAYLSQIHITPPK